MDWTKQNGKITRHMDPTHLFIASPPVVYPIIYKFTKKQSI